MATPKYVGAQGAAAATRNLSQVANAILRVGYPIMSLRRRGTNAGLLFKYSPSEINSTHQVEYSSPKTTGTKDVNEQYVKTKADSWTFTLFLNDYGDYNERASGFGLPLSADLLGVEETIALLVAYTKPEKVSAKLEGDTKTGFPEQPPILELFTGFLVVTCTIRELSVKRTMFHPQTGRTLRATVEISLKEQIDPKSPKAKSTRALTMFERGYATGNQLARGNYGTAVNRAFERRR